MRYSLRTLLILVTILAVLLGLRLSVARRQAAAVRQLIGSGSHACYDFEFDFKNGERIPDARSWVPDWLVKRTGLDLFHNVVDITIDNGLDAAAFDDTAESAVIARYIAALPKLRSIWISQGGDKCVTEVSRHSGLEHLKIRYAVVTDKGVAQLPALRHLRSLTLYSSSLTDDSLHHIGTLSRLEELQLDGKRFTDTGLARLKNLKHLKKLSLGADEMEITDSGLVHLEELGGLETVWFSYTDLTLDGVSRIKRRIPSLDISF